MNIPLKALTLRGLRAGVLRRLRPGRVRTRKSGAPAAPVVAALPPQDSHRETTPPRPTPVYSRDVAPLIDRYCLACHEGEDAEGGIVLDILGNDPGDAKRGDLLLRIDGVLRSESMPPEEEPRPTLEQRAILEAWLDHVLAARERGEASTRMTIRRLNRTEYNNTIRDLIGLDLHPADDFPADDIGYGFDNIADVLATPPILVEMQLAAAESAIEAAFRSPEARRRIMTPARRHDPAGIPEVHRHRSAALEGTSRSGRSRRPWIRSWPGSSISTISSAPSPTGPSAGPRPTTS